MDATKIKVGQKVKYRSRAHTGTGKVDKVETKATGTWVTVNDTNRNAYVTVRPSQVDRA